MPQLFHRADAHWHLHVLTPDAVVSPLPHGATGVGDCGLRRRRCDLQTVDASDAEQVSGGEYSSETWPDRECPEIDRSRPRASVRQTTARRRRQYALHLDMVSGRAPPAHEVTAVVDDALVERARGSGRHDFRFPGEGRTVPGLLGPRAPGDPRRLGLFHVQHRRHEQRSATGPAFPSRSHSR